MRYILVRGIDGKILVNSLVDDSEAISVISTHRSSHEIFLSIADYSTDTQVSCPLYFDIDSKNLEEACGITLDIRDLLMSDFQVNPYVFFSGSKGFHILMPFKITHPRCNDIAKKIAVEYSNKIDQAVYKTRQMWRVNGSLHLKTRRYKVLLPLNLPSVDECIRLSSEGISADRPFEYVANSIFDKAVKEKEKTLTNKKIEPIIIDSDRHTPPCLINMFNLKEGPPPGERHNFLNNFIRHLRLKGYDKEGVVNILMAHPYWSTVSKSDYTKVINTIYGYASVGFGCKSGMGLTLRKYCHDSCISYLLVNGLK